MPKLSNYPSLIFVREFARKKKTELYIVGGFLRDALSGKSGKDFDFAVPQNALSFSRAFARSIKGAFVLLDKEHGCGRVVKKNGLISETFDFSDFRGKTIKSDMQHRDFTVNALTAKLDDLKPGDDLRDAIMDFTGGKKDLKARRLRMVSENAFREDPLRLMRAFSLKAQLGLTVEKATLARIKKDKDLLRTVARERILDELFKVLQAPGCGDHLAAMDKIGLLVQVIPQITVMYNVIQGGYHHLDVWQHSLETVRQLEDVLKAYTKNPDVENYLNEPLAGNRTRRGLLYLAALLHDIGKPQTRRPDKDRMTFHGHEHVGRDICRSVAKLLLLSVRERMMLEDIVLWHLRPGYLSNFQKPGDRALFRYFRDTKKEAASIALLSMADQRATRGPLSQKTAEKHHIEICGNLVRKFFASQKERPFVRLINGDDLITVLQLTPSPAFGKILRDVQEAQATGKITTKDEALALAKKIAGKITATKKGDHDND